MFRLSERLTPRDNEKNDQLQHGELIAFSCSQSISLEITLYPEIHPLKEAFDHAVQLHF